VTREELEALLAQLDPDREKAGERYEIIRHKLVRLFEWRGCDSPEDLADVTLDRVAHRLGDGVELRQSSDSFGYFYGVAHLVYKEFLRRYSREQRVRDSGELPQPIYMPEEEEPTDRRLECLRRCLSQVPQDQRDLLLRYHQGENNIRNRKALASELGIPLNALRIRVHRIRRKVEDCVHRCLSH